MWCSSLDHDTNKAWLADKLSRTSRVCTETPTDGHPQAAAGVAVRMYSLGFGWEDGEIVYVLPGGRASIRWESGAVTTTPDRKIAKALEAASTPRKKNPPEIPRGPWEGEAGGT